jgi:hypothetical protein
MGKFTLTEKVTFICFFNDLQNGFQASSSSSKHAISPFRVLNMAFQDQDPYLESSSEYTARLKIEGLGT